MARIAKASLVRGVVAGMVGGLVASWVMNEFIAGPGKAVRHAVQTDAENAEEARKASDPETPATEDATMKTAAAIYHAASGGAHLSWEGEERGGPIVHYAFGTLTGGLYGGLAEYVPPVRAGLGTTFGGVLFTGADLVAVPFLNLSGPSSDSSVRSLATPFSAHLVYGVTVELVRRGVRRLL